MPISPRRTFALVLPAVLLATLAAALPAQAAEQGVVRALRETGNTRPEAETSRQIGAKWFRLFVDWSVTETADGQYDPGRLAAIDRIVDANDARGIKTIAVVSRFPRWTGAPDEITPGPASYRKYGEFMAFLAERYRGRMNAWELWNEPDGNVFWRNGPQPVQYAALLREGYAGVKSKAPGTPVISGGMVGNDYRFLDALYANGAKGSFDAVGVHTDTSCLTAPPTSSYREADGRLGRFAFTGYRQVRQSMIDHGEDKPIWMTEIGWSTTPSPCTDPNKGGPGGVSEAKQAQYLTEAYQCLKADPYVGMALWFSLQDINDKRPEYDYQLGLFRANGSAKPAVAAFQKIDSLPPKACGLQVDKTPPVVKLKRPTDGLRYAGALPIQAEARDDQQVTRIYLYHGFTRISASFGNPDGDGFASGKLTYQGAKKLPNGTQVITAVAYDAAGNAGYARALVKKVDAKDLDPVRTRTKVSFRFPSRKARGSARRHVRVSGRTLTRGGKRVKGKVQVDFQRRVVKTVKGKRKAVYRSAHRYTKGASKSFRYTARIKRAGRYRVRARFLPKAPYKASHTRYRYFSVR